MRRVPSALLIVLLGSACGGDVQEDGRAYCERVADWSLEWTELEDEVLALTNQRRAAGATCGSVVFGPAPAVGPDVLLRCAARNHSRAMALDNFFDHIAPSGETPADRVERAGYAWAAVGENLAGGHTTAAAVVQGWMGSPGHCSVLMDAIMTELGVGYYRQRGEAALWTQIFATPR